MKLRTAFALPVLLLTTPVHADEEERQEIYNSLLSCAAFHTIEASKTSGDSSAAQQASAYDYAEAAATFAPDGKTATTNADLQAMLTAFNAKLNEGEPRAMAEHWTVLETSCNELHPLKDSLVAKRKAELAGPTSAQP
jgi:hypothetical protein